MERRRTQQRGIQQVQYAKRNSVKKSYACRTNLLLFKLVLIITLLLFFRIVAPARTPTRPKSVPPQATRFSEKARHSYTKNPELFYMTTNKREFGGKFGHPGENAR